MIPEFDEDRVDFPVLSRDRLALLIQKLTVDDKVLVNSARINEENLALQISVTPSPSNLYNLNDLDERMRKHMGLIYSAETQKPLNNLAPHTCDRRYIFKHKSYWWILDGTCRDCSEKGTGITLFWEGRLNKAGVDYVRARS